MADQEKNSPVSIGELIASIVIPDGPMTDDELLALAKGEWGPSVPAPAILERPVGQSSARVAKRPDQLKAEPSRKLPSSPSRARRGNRGR